MPTARETALAALAAQLAAAFPTGPEVLRNAELPGAVPAEGLLVLLDGSTIEEEPLLSPLSWDVVHEADLVVAVRASTEAAATAALDALLSSVAAAIAANRTLGGAVEWAEAGAPVPDTTDATDASRIHRAASVSVRLWFNTGSQVLA